MSRLRLKKCQGPPLPTTHISDVGTLRVVLPWPQSENHYWSHFVINGKARVGVSTETKAYRKAVALAARLQNADKNLTGRLAVRVYLEAPRKIGKHDIPNREKSLYDAMTQAHIWQDDELIDDIRLVRGPRHQEGRVTVTITQAGTPDELKAAPTATGEAA